MSNDQNVSALLNALLAQNEASCKRVESQLKDFSKKIESMGETLAKISVHAEMISNVEKRIDRVDKRIDDADDDIKKIREDDLHNMHAKHNSLMTKVSALESESTRRKELSKTLMTPLVRHAVTFLVVALSFIFCEAYTHINETAHDKADKIINHDHSHDL